MYIPPLKKDNTFNTSLPHGHHSFSLSLTRRVGLIQTKYRHCHSESAVIIQHVKILEDSGICCQEPGCKAGHVAGAEGATLGVGEGDHIELQHSHLPQD